MNYSKHAENSAAIFGGNPEDYFGIHNTIDGNEIAAISPYGNFYLHHYDIGGAILEGLFGCKIGEAPVKKILLQHLVEDYGQVPLFRDWVINGKVPSIKYCSIDPSRKDSDLVYMKRRLSGEGLKNISTRTIRKIEGLLSLRYFTQDVEILKRMESPMSCCVFGHATGISLAEKLIGEKMNGYNTIDLLKVYYGIRFQKVPTISDYIECWIQEKKWMKWVDLATAHFDSINEPTRVIKRMERIINENRFGAKEMEFPKNNLDIPKLFNFPIRPSNEVYGPVNRKSY